ncbi:MAG: hypothetical protein GX811_10835, partial [Lentisphaerae bacterium]|nr:hypothetical protein [Lentisphaerota bacterium]
MNKHVHVSGIAGSGMSALAQVLQISGYEVSGSDRLLDRNQDLPVFEKLRKSGIKLVPQDGSGITERTSCLAVSTAIESDNPDILKALSSGTRVVHRATLLAELMEGKRCIAIAGTSGKSTTTGMVGWILEQAGYDPFVVNGGAVLNWKNDSIIGNVRPGSSDIWVVEVDESDRSLLNFRPEMALITNMSKDHFDLPETEKLFKQFSDLVTQGVIGCFGSPSREEIFADFAPELTPGRIKFNYRDTPFSIPQTGAHNAENAVMAVTLCEKLGVLPQVAAEAMSRFKGVERRLELIGKYQGADIIDDYAHNPKKISAVWNALTDTYRNITGVWRPHGYAPLRTMMDELFAIFSKVVRSGDKLFILPVFDAGGTAQRNVQSDTLT